MERTNVQQANVVVAIGTLNKAREVLGEDVLVEMGLKGTHFHAENSLALCRERGQHILLQPP